MDTVDTMSGFPRRHPEERGDEGSASCDSLIRSDSGPFAAFGTASGGVRARELQPAVKDIGATLPAAADLTDLGLVDPSATTGVSGIRAFDVGQGDCIGLLDQAGDVFCYVDYGGFHDHPDAAHPAHTARRLPDTVKGRRVPVVLTHWDIDHYLSAHRKNTAMQQCRWLVPRQLASPHAVRFAARLANAACWPESQGSTPVRIAVGATDEIEIRKCKAFDPTATHEDRNLSGLAITLVHTYADARAAMIVLPGDCAFHRIPHCPNVEIRGLVAYHHGSHVHWSAATTSAIAKRASPRAMFYSHGRNAYGHPVRTNYAPHWDPHADTAPAVRARGAESTDIVW